MKLTKRQRDTLTLMEESGRPLIFWSAGDGVRNFYLGQAAEIPVHTWTAHGLIHRVLVSADHERTNPQHYWINEAGRQALDGDSK